MKVIDLTGQQFGKLTVLNREENDLHGRTRWRCQCECGNIKIISGAELRRKGSRAGTQACGRCKNLIDLTNQTFGRLTVLERDFNDTKNTKWICQCTCGNITSASSYDLRLGKITSCGCYRKEHLSDIRTLNLLNKRFGKLLVIDRTENKNGHSQWVCQCDCGNKIIVSCEALMGGRQSCGCSISNGEAIIENFLITKNYIYKKQYKFNDLLSENNYPLKFDFAILNTDNRLLFLIEYDGEQHFNQIDFFGDLKLWQQRDNMKNEYCSKNNIPLIRFNYIELNNHLLTYEYILQKIEKETLVHAE